MSSSIKKDDDEVMEKAKKFLFDTHDFDEETPEEEEKPTFSEDQLLLAKEKAFEDGRQAGLNESREQKETAILAAVQQMAGQIDALTQAEDIREVSKCRDTVHLTSRIIKKILPQLSKKTGLDEIEHLILQSLEQRHDEPRIAIMVNPALLDNFRERIDHIANEKGFAGKVILLADDDLKETDCRVEWANGGADRLYDRLLQSIETELNKAIAGFNAISPAPPEESNMVEAEADVTTETQETQDEPVNQPEGEIKND